MNLKAIREFFPSVITPATRNRLLFGFKLVITVVLIWYFKDKFSDQNFWRLLLSANPVLLTGAFLFSFVNFGFQIAKWRVLSEACFSKPKYWDALRSFFQGMAIGIVSPLRAGEIVGRKLYHDDVSFMSISLTTLADKLENFTLNMLVGALSALIYLVTILHITGNTAFLLIGIVSIWVLLFLSLMIYPHVWKRLMKKTGNKFRLGAYVMQTLEPLSSINGKTLRVSFFYSAVSYAVLMVQYALLIISYDDRVPFFTGMHLGSLTIFAKSMVPALTFIDFGIRELSSMYFAKNLGFNEAAGFNAAFILFIINLVIPSFIGMILFAFKKNDGHTK